MSDRITTDDLIRYRLDRAFETLEEAVILKRENHWNACLNRLYYACFYAVSALLYTEGLNSGKHTGVKSFFNKYWVKTGKVSKEMGRFYNQLFESRQEGDYIDFVMFDQQTVEPLIPKAEEFVRNIASLIE